MSVATPPAGGGAGGYQSPTAAPPLANEACPLCGTALDPEQEWCLRCGAAARTRLAASPSWKTPVIVLAVLVALSLGVLAAALVTLAGGSGHSTTAGATVIVTTVPAVTTAPATTVPPTTTIPPTTTAAPGTSTPTTGLPDTTTGTDTTAPSATTPGATATTPGLTTPTTKSSTTPTTPKAPATTPSHTTTSTTPPASNPLVEESPKK